MTMKKTASAEISAAWGVLAVLTVVSWAMGTAQGNGAGHVLAGVAILTVAVFKVRIVGLHFMELRDAPWALRSVFEGYCVVLLTLLCVMYLLV
jgi:Prokaryotic Cytochrome C oxidase subunit IV